MNRHQTAHRMFAVLSIAFMLSASAADAKGGATISVTMGGSATGTVVSGTIAISNASAKPVAVTVINGLEVRFPTGYPAPALPPGSTTGYFQVATVALPSP